MAPQAPHLSCGRNRAGSKGQSWLWEGPARDSQEGAQKPGGHSPERLLSPPPTLPAPPWQRRLPATSTPRPRGCSHLQVRPLLHLLGLLLGGALQLLLLLVALQSPQLLLDPAPLLAHLLPVLLVKEGKLPAGTQESPVRARPDYAPPLPSPGRQAHVAASPARIPPQRRCHRGSQERQVATLATPARPCARPPLPHRRLCPTHVAQGPYMNSSSLVVRILL